MNIKTMLVFYGEDNLPYKDKERQTHYPVSGSAFMGASNTTEIRFYIDKIGDTSTTWVANTKLPNGKTGYKVLESAFDSELNENYVVLPLDTFYTQAKGDLYISLGGYAGGVEVVEDEETGIYSIVGTPTIQATGVVKIAINYSTIYTGGQEQGIDIQQILAELGRKINKDADQYFRIVDTFADINTAENRDFLKSGALVMTADNGNIYLLSGTYPFNTTKKDFFQEKYIKTNVRAYTNSTDLANDLANLVENQIVLYNADGKIVCYKVKVSSGQKTYDQQKFNVFWDSIVGDIEDNQELIDYLDTHYANSQRVDDLESDLESEITARENADANLQDQIDDIVAKSDVVDVVGTYAELQAYDKTKLGDNDIIKVLVDETHNNAISYYRFNKATNTFIYINSIGPYSKVSASESGTSTTLVRYITIDGTEYKLPTGGGSGGGIIISVSEDESGIPQIATEQMTTIYNAIAIDGSNVVLQTETDKNYIVLGTKVIEDVIYVYILLNEDYIVKYTLDDEEEYASAETKQISGAVSSVNGKTGVVVLDATDIKLTTNLQTVQANFIRVDGEIERVEQETQETTDDLQDQINNLSSRGRYLSGWNALTGLPLTDPTTELPYEYRAGDYYVISVINYADYDSTNTYNLGDHCFYNGNNYTCNENGVSGEFDSTKWTLTTPQRYKPSGSEYNGQPSTTIETNEIKVNDTYMYDGTSWVYQATAPVDLGNYYTKDQTDNLLDEKASVDSNNYAEVQGITDGTNSTSVAEIANGLFNTINASDIASDGVLTQEQYNLIINGKPTLIKGGRVAGINITSPFLSPAKLMSSPQQYAGYFITRTTDNNSGSYIGYYLIEAGRKINFETNIGFGNTKATGLSLLGKSFPTYTKGDLHYNGTNLIFKATTIALTDNSITQLSFNKTNVMTLSADRTFTFETTPSISGTNLSYIPEYKAIITTTADVDITLPSGTYKLLTNDEDNIVLTDKVLSLPTDSEIEISIQNGKIIAVNWSL